MGRETGAALKELLARAAQWPEEAQAEAVRSLEEIERELEAPLSQADLKALAQSRDDLGKGRFASDKEMRALFDRYRAG